MTTQQKIISQIEKTGFRLVDEQDNYFSHILKRKILFTDNVFVLAEYKAGESVRDIILKGCLWNKENLNGFFETVSNSGLNIIIFHAGELSLADIKGKCTWIAIPGATKVILTSITIINILNNKIEQDRTWILLPALKRTLTNISRALI